MSSILGILVRACCYYKGLPGVKSRAHIYSLFSSQHRLTFNDNFDDLILSSLPSES